MTTTSSTAAGPRSGRGTGGRGERSGRGGRGGATSGDPIRAGLPDPRAVTGYSVEYSEESGGSRLVVTLDQPCVVREPEWGVVSCLNGEVILLAGAADGAGTPGESNTVLVFDYDGILGDEYNFVLVPYQDAKVQNFRGGFVEPGARWFREYKG